MCFVLTLVNYVHHPLLYRTLEFEVLIWVTQRMIYLVLVFSDAVVVMACAITRLSEYVLEKACESINKTALCFIQRCTESTTYLYEKMYPRYGCGVFTLIQLFRFSWCIRWLISACGTVYMFDSRVYYIDHIDAGLAVRSFPGMLV